MFLTKQRLSCWCISATSLYYMDGAMQSLPSFNATDVEYQVLDIESYAVALFFIRLKREGGLREESYRWT